MTVLTVLTRTAEACAVHGITPDAAIATGLTGIKLAGVLAIAAAIAIAVIVLVGIADDDTSGRHRPEHVDPLHAVTDAHPELAARGHAPRHLTGGGR